MNFEEKMQARHNRTVEVTVHETAPIVGAGLTGIEAKLARHKREGKTEAQRVVEAKAAEAKASVKPESKPAEAKAHEHKK